MIKALANFWRRISLKNHKKRGLFEIEQDIKFLEKFKAESLYFDEGPARVRMAELKVKEDRTEKEQDEYELLLGQIALSKATKAEHKKSVEVAEDVRKYISMM